MEVLFVGVIVLALLLCCCCWCFYFKYYSSTLETRISDTYLKEQLIDELWLTIEPKIFGTGGNFVIEEQLDINLKLTSCEKVNEQGTLITKYAVIKK